MKLSDLLDKLGVTCNEGRGEVDVQDAWDKWKNPWQMGYVLKLIAVKQSGDYAWMKLAALFDKPFPNSMAFSAGFDTASISCDEIRRLVPDPLVFMAQ